MSEKDVKYDVVEVEISTLNVRVLSEDDCLADADAIMKMAVIRRGVENHFYAPVPANRYSDGDKWEGGAVYATESKASHGHIRIGDIAYPQGPRGRDCDEDY